MIHLLPGKTYAHQSNDTEDKTTTNKLFNVVELRATVVPNGIYFNVTVNKESENCAYSLVRFDHDGSMISVGLKDGFKNENELDLLYSFKDISVPEADCSYALYRFGSKSDIIGKWNYSHQTKQIETEK